MNKQRGMFLLTLAIVFCASAAWAASTPGANSPLEFIESFTSQIGDKLLAFARSLFVALATLSLAMGLARSILSGESNIGSVAAQLTKWIIYVGLFMWIMSSTDAVFFIPKVIVNSFMQAGSSISGQEVAPDDLLTGGIRLYGTMVERGWQADWGDFIGIIIIGIVILVVVAMLAGIMAVALIEMHLVICGGAILLGFAGFEQTRDVAYGYMKYSISIGIKILMIMIVYVLASELLTDWESSFKATADIKTLISMAGQILGGTIAILMAARMVPSMAQSIVSGSAGHFGHEMVTSTAAGMTNAVLGHKTASGERSGGVAGALRTARNVQTSAFQGIANTFDAKKEGGLAGAAAYVAASTPGVRNFVNAAQSGGVKNALGYVKASVLYGSQSDRAIRHLNKGQASMEPGTQAQPQQNKGETAMTTERPKKE